MTRFELAMLELAKVKLNEDFGCLQMEICNNGSGIPCSFCPIREKCDELHARHVEDSEEMDIWLREEIDDVDVYTRAYNAGKEDVLGELGLRIREACLNGRKCTLQIGGRIFKVREVPQ